MTVDAAARGALLPPLSETDLVNAARLKQRCLRAANLKGTRVIGTDPSGMPAGTVGLFTDDASPSARRILIRLGLDPVEEALTIAHEVGHLYDPDLNHSDMASRYQRTRDVCESVACMVAMHAAREWNLMGAVPDGWFDALLASHGSSADLIDADDRLTHRADCGALMVVPSDAAETLRARRAAEGRPLSGNSTARRMFVAAKSFLVGPGKSACGKWMPRAKQRCVLPLNHSGHCSTVK